MNRRQKLADWRESHDGEDYCGYCIYEEGCPKDVVCHGDNPIEPPCCGEDDILEILDTEAILEDMEKE